MIRVCITYEKSPDAAVYSLASGRVQLYPPINSNIAKRPRVCVLGRTLLNAFPFGFFFHVSQVRMYISYTYTMPFVFLGGMKVRSTASYAPGVRFAKRHDNQPCAATIIALLLVCRCAAILYQVPGRRESILEFLWTYYTYFAFCGLRAGGVRCGTAYSSAYNTAYVIVQQ